MGLDRSLTICYTYYMNEQSLSFEYVPEVIAAATAEEQLDEMLKEMYEFLDNAA